MPATQAQVTHGSGQARPAAGYNQSASCSPASAACSSTAASPPSSVWDADERFRSSVLQTAANRA